MYILIQLVQSKVPKVFRLVAFAILSQRNAAMHWSLLIIASFYTTQWQTWGTRHRGQIPLKTPHTGTFGHVLALSSHMCFELPFCCPVYQEFLFFSPLLSLLFRGKFSRRHETSLLLRHLLLWATQGQSFESQATQTLPFFLFFSLLFLSSFWWKKLSAFREGWVEFPPPGP